ncbi:helix-turn-helix domain-containing protein [Reinekea marina]|uniref:Helix-turn-helix domain-containing protein n=2 Tax=Reinekea marina TaxID=1310421 RepID=A0ABV7WUH1_9GAMM
MIHSIIQPCIELRGIVSHFWTGSWESILSKPNNTHYIIANRLTEITFAFNNTKPNADLVFSSIQGHTYLPRTAVVSEYNHLIGVTFNSYALNRVFDTQALDLSNEFISVDTFLGSKGKTLNEMIASPNTTEKRIKILSDFILSMLNERFSNDRLILNSINKIDLSLGTLRIEDLAKKYHLSEKQFGRRFKAFTGFSPKIFSRIVRFEASIANQINSDSLTDLAQKTGYFDQAHFNNEFKSLTGFSPKNFWKLKD